MIRFLGQQRDFNDQDPAAQIRALRGIAEDLSSPSWSQLGDAVASYLDLVEATVQLGNRLACIMCHPRHSANDRGSPLPPGG
jgi:hypothetical protein